MAMLDYEKSKFRFSETFNNSDGKTSGSGFVGVLMGLCVLTGFISGSIGWFLKMPDSIEYLNIVLQLGLLAAALMGIRKVSGMFGKKDPAPETPEEEKG